LNAGSTLCSANRQSLAILAILAIASPVAGIGAKC
jgi:hypothetical protein